MLDLFGFHLQVCRGPTTPRNARKSCKTGMPARYMHEVGRRAVFSYISTRKLHRLNTNMLLDHCIPRKGAQILQLENTTTRRSMDSSGARGGTLNRHRETTAAHSIQLIVSQRNSNCGRKVAPNIMDNQVQEQASKRFFKTIFHHWSCVNGAKCTPALTELLRNKGQLIRNNQHRSVTHYHYGLQ